MIKIYYYMKSKEDTVDVQITYKCLHICTCLSNLKLVDDISDDFDQEYWFLCLHYEMEAIFPDIMSHLRNIYDTA